MADVIALTDSYRTADGEGLAATISGFLAGRLWCVVEVRAGDEPWEPRLLICKDDVGKVAEAVRRWDAAPGESVRVAGYSRDTLRRMAFAPRALNG